MSSTAPSNPADRTPRSRGRSLARRLGFAAMAAASLIALTAAAPEPDPVPRRWQLDLYPGALRVASFDIPGVGQRMFLYMDYAVVNNSGQDLLFAPAFELANGEGEILRSGRDVPNSVTESIVASLQNPYSQDQIEIIGTLLQGREHGKDGVVIWPVTDANPERLTVYAAGFSGETATVEPPNSDIRFVLRKTLRMDFDSPGDMKGVRNEVIPVREQSWIMR
jgi:hypothetical protein